jgi:actin-related protein
MEAKNKDDNPFETLLWGDDLGIITMYKFMKESWHICSFKKFKKPDREYLTCHESDICKDYDSK